jgi:hypothetical protein
MAWKEGGVVSRANYLSEPNPNWDSLLTEEEKNFLHDTRWSVDLHRLPAEAVKKLVAAAMRMFEETEEEGTAGEGGAVSLVWRCV